MAAEIVKNYLPKIVDLHNYAPANAISQKIYNWNTLNRTFKFNSVLLCLYGRKNPPEV